MKLFTDSLQFAALLDFALHEDYPVFELFTLLCLCPCDIAHFFLLLTGSIQVILEFLCLGLTSPVLILPVLDVFFANLNIILQLGRSLLILINFDLVILVLVHGSVQLQFFLF